jgi:hypothetical protein
MIGLWRKIDTFFIDWKSDFTRRAWIGIEEEDDGGHNNGSDVDYDMKDDY